MLKAELKSTNSILTQQFDFSRCDRALCRAVLTASSVEQFAWYAGVVPGPVE